MQKVASVITQMSNSSFKHVDCKDTSGWVPLGQKGREWDQGQVQQASIAFAVLYPQNTWNLT